MDGLIAWGLPILIGAVLGYVLPRRLLTTATALSLVVAIISLVLWNREMELMLSLVIIVMLAIANVAMWVSYAVTSGGLPRRAP